jgi:hypothetical protein
VKNAALGSLNFSDYVSTQIGAHTSISATRYRAFVAQHPDQTSYFQPVLDLLDYRPSLVEPVPGAVLVEGKSDFYLLRYATEVLGLQCDIRFVPGTGAGTLDPVIKLHIGWAKSFIVLLDGDAEGKRQCDRYARVYGPTLDNRVLLLPDACGDASAKEAESLLAEADKTALIGAVYTGSGPRPSPKKALSQAVLELYARKETVPLQSDTVTRIERLIAVLTEALASQS